jgi:hypothetical protein
VIDPVTGWHMQAVPASSRRVSPTSLPSIALALVLAPGLGCDDGRLECGEAPEIAVAATFEGQSHAFDEGSATIYMAGTVEDPCIDFVEVFAKKSQGGSLTVLLSPPEGGGPMEVVSVDFSSTDGDYGLYLEDYTKFSATFELERQSEDCAEASAEVTGSDARMFLEASEDWGPYMLTNVNVAVSGTYAIEWQEDATCD